MTQTVICFKTRQPVIYNAGTKCEKRCDTFLAYYTYKTPIEAQKEVDELNRTKPVKDWRGLPIDWDSIDHFFVNQQEEMY